MSSSAILHIMSRAAERAAFLLVRDFGELEKLQISRKGFKNFVTSSDRNSEEKICYELSKARPSFSFICEESGLRDNEDSGSIWIVDPIDGTNNFMRGIPYFAISIGLCVNKEFIAGLTLDPMRGDCFKAEIGYGAFLGNRNRLRVSRREGISESIVATRTDWETDKKFVEAGAMLRRTGSLALDLAYLAAGKYDVVVANGAQIWDMAAGIPLIKEAGGFLEYHKNERSGKYDIVAGATSKLLSETLKLL